MKTTAAAIKPFCSLKCDKTNDGQLFDYISRINNIDWDGLIIQTGRNRKA